MPTYTVEFNTDAETAFRQIKAKSPQSALRAARRIASIKSDELDFRAYDSRHPVDEIVIECDGKEACRWQSDDLRLRLAAPDLLAAACNILDSWATADLGKAVRELAAVVAEARHGKNA